MDKDGGFDGKQCAQARSDRLDGYRCLGTVARRLLRLPWAAGRQRQPRPAVRGRYPRCPPAWPGGGAGHPPGAGQPPGPRPMDDRQQCQHRLPATGAAARCQPGCICPAGRLRGAGCVARAAARRGWGGQQPDPGKRPGLEWQWPGLPDPGRKRPAGQPAAGQRSAGQQRRARAVATAQPGAVSPGWHRYPGRRAGRHATPGVGPGSLARLRTRRCTYCRGWRDRPLRPGPESLP
ncbi:hypothetical protein D3C76_523110 [compost metagenome]